MPGTEKKRKAQTRSPEYLAQLRHSCAHVMAQAVQEMFPGTKIAIGPAIENGFYYDFDSPHHFTPEDLPKIEARMLEIAKGNHIFKRLDVSKADSVAFWKKRDEKYKLELLEGLKDGEISHYSQDTYTDLCRGNHLETTEGVRHFKLTQVAGAYWRGNENNPMLQRIYGTAWASKEDLEAYLHQLEEAKKRDHRKLGAELGLFSTHEEVGAGLIHWHPKGAVIRFQIESYIRGLLAEHGYQFVYTPHIASEQLYKISGHLEAYKDLMYGAMDIEGQPFRAKPMNCPMHVMIYKTGLHSYRELPIRYAEYGTVYRFEKSGVLHGLLRVRGFTQDDAHLFCTPDQIQDEVSKLIALATRVYKDFGFDKVLVFLSTRPEKYVGELELWQRAEDGLKSAMDAQSVTYEVEEGGGAFYGPKIDLKVKDAIGREWQLCTIQLDFNLPRRFGATYRAATGKDEYAVMIHRALIGSFERFTGVLIEHFAGHFPLWLAPVQLAILTLTDEQAAFAKKVAAELVARGFRVTVDDRSDKIGLKIREASLQKVPYMAVIGPKEVEAGTLTVRLRDGKNVSGLSVEQLAEKLSLEVKEKRLTSVLA